MSGVVLQFIKGTQMKKNKCLLICLLLSFSSFAQAKLLLTAPPRETPKEAQQFFGPIADELSKYIGEEVVYQRPNNWIEYARDMRAGKYDLVFDGPQFASWRIVHLDHAPIASLEGKLQFYIVAYKSHKEIKNLKSILGKNLCGVPSPNLGTLAAFNMFNDPIVQPTVVDIKGGMKGVVEAFFKGECDAAVIRSDLYQRWPDEKKNSVNILARSRIMPNQSITATKKKINAEKIKKMQEFFLSPNGAKSADNLLERFSKKKKFFVSANEQDFEGLNELLEGVVFGW